jgi:two-component system, OmpR family, sensor kinase ParS
VTRLFLKLWCLVLITSLLSYQLQTYVFDRAASDRAVSNAHEQYRRTFIYLEQALKPYPMADWPKRYADIARAIGPASVFAAPTRLLSVAELRTEPGIDGAILARILSEQPYVRRLPGNHEAHEIFHTLSGTDMIGVLQAPIRPPVLVWGTFSSTTVTWFVESVLYAGAVLLWLATFWRDMRRINAAGSAIGAGDFDVRVNLSDGAALAPLADGFNRMAERIRTLVKAHKHLSNAISHELRTPIGMLRLRHDMARGAAAIEDKDQQLDLMAQAIDQLDDLATEMAEYARLDREQPNLDRFSFSAGPWLDELTHEALALAKARGRDIAVEGHAAEETIDGDLRYLTRAASNLLRNAVGYAAHRVRVGVRVRADQFVLEVEDDGPGIPAEERERLLDPLARIDLSRDRRSGGFGLGLAIVGQIARWHGGEVAISESALGGARVELHWPVRPVINGGSA